MENIVEEVRKFVEEECKKPTSCYGYDVFENHFAPVVKYAKGLAIELGGDIEIVEIAGWLHDIGSIIYGRKEHHITGAQIAEKKLIELGYPREKIELVKKCILNHRGSIKNERKSVEERIIAEADSMSHFDNVSGIFMAAYMYEGEDSQKIAKEKTMQKLINSYNKLSDRSKEIIKPRYEAAKVLLGENES